MTFSYIIIGKNREKKAHIGENRAILPPIWGKIVRFSIFEIYFIYFLSNDKKIWNNTEKIQRILRFGSNFKGMDNIMLFEGDVYFRERGLGAPSDFLHSLDISN